MTERLVVVANVSGSLFRGLFKAQGACADRYPVTVFELMFEVGLTIDEDFVCAATKLTVYYRAIDDRKDAVFRLIDV
jgi:hypothetical protein